jgi:hypothetical protein
MLVAMLVNVAAFTLVYIALLAARTDVKRQEEGARALQPAAGDAVIPPRFDGVPDV